MAGAPRPPRPERSAAVQGSLSALSRTALVSVAVDAFTHLRRVQAEHRADIDDGTGLELVPMFDDVLVSKSHRATAPPLKGVIRCDVRGVPVETGEDDASRLAVACAAEEEAVGLVRIKDLVSRRHQKRLTEDTDSRDEGPGVADFKRLAGQHYAGSGRDMKQYVEALSMVMVSGAQGRPQAWL